MTGRNPARPSIPRALWDAIEIDIENGDLQGYSSPGEFVRDAVRKHYHAEVA